MKGVVESTFFNDEYLANIAICLLKEIESVREGQKFRKIIPSMAFSCFALESKLNSCGKTIFKGTELKKFMNSQIQGKTDWLLSRIEADTTNPDVAKNREKITEMISFRNAVTHSKPIDFKEERELIGIEKINPKFLLPKRSETDFMANYSADKAKEFYDALTNFKLIWLHYSGIYFEKNKIEPDYHIPRARIVPK